MSISSEIVRISGAKADIKTAITGKGVTVPSTAKIDDMADYIDQIEQGVTPTGNINITTMNQTDVTNYATAQIVDADIVAGNIKSGVNILGVVGTYAGKVYQAAIDVGTSTSTSYTDAGLELTVAKTGTYKVSWNGFRTATSGTAGSQMYKNGTAYGSPNTTFGNLSNYGQINILEHVSLQAGDNLKIYARSRGSGYAMFVGGFLIEEE